ncbi:MAG TPA: hypothetical protein PKV71_05865 [Calditrichia bacterium]|nr:hypothetical protein [Calditrichia bacterium]
MRKTVLKILMLFCLASPALIGQVGEITRDTSFTPRSAFQKERLRFPFIEMVREKVSHPFWLFHPWFSETVDRVGRFLDKVLENK